MRVIGRRVDNCDGRVPSGNTGSAWYLQSWPLVIVVIPPISFDIGY